MLNKADSFEEGRISDVSDQCLFEVCVAVHDLLSPGAECRGCHFQIFLGHCPSVFPKYTECEHQKILEGYIR